MTKKRKILCVDDDHSILRTLELYLKDKYDVTLVDKPLRGIEMALTGEYDIIFLDYHMPGILGMEVAAKIEESGIHSLCILLTSHADSDLAVQVMNNDAVFKYMLKPFNMKALTETLEGAIQALG